MIELSITKNNNDKSASYGKFYPRVRYKQTMNIRRRPTRPVLPCSR